MTETLISSRTSDIVLMDGAMGTELYQAGLEENECAEEWNLSRPERVRAVHHAYYESGARCLLTNTFQANPCALLRHELEDRLDAICASALRQAHDAIQEPCPVLASIGPIHIEGAEEEFPEWDDLRLTAGCMLNAAYLHQFTIHGFLLETCSSPRALSAAAYLRHHVTEGDIPIYLSIAYHRRNGSILSFSGHKPETFARHAEGHGVAALGVNCGRDIGLSEIIEILKRYRDVTALPLFARPNAGSPERRGGQCHYPLSAEELGDRAGELVEAGAGMIGGCCGTTPAHIAAIRKNLGL